MRRFLAIALVLSSLVLAVPSCQSPSQPEPDPQLIISGSGGLDIGTEGGSGSISFTANCPWTASCADGWIHLSPTSGAGSDAPVSVSVQCDANTTYDDRVGTVTIKAGDLVKTVTVRQPGRLGLVVPTKEYILSSDARSIEVEVQANVDYSVIVSADWIKQTGTKGLTSHKLVFSVEANDTPDGRSATITIKAAGSDVAEVVNVTQAQKDALIVGDKRFDMPYGGGEIEVRVEANVSFDVRTNATWIHHVRTRGLESSIVCLSVDENGSNDTRTGTVEIVGKDGSLSHTVTITQQAAPGLLVSPGSMDLTNAAQTVEFEVRKNVDYTVTVDEACRDWIVQTRSKALSSEKVQFSIAANTAYQEREGRIVFEQTGGGLVQTVTIRQGEANGLFITTPEYEITNEAQTLSVEVKSNVSFEVVSQNDWIKYVKTKGYDSSVITLSIEANKAYDGRTGTVLVKQTDGDLTGTITVTQSEAAGLFVTPAEATLSCREQTVELEVQNNVSFSVVIPEEAREWVSVRSNTQTRALTSDKVILAVAENGTYDERSVSVTFKQTDGPLAQTVVIRQAQSYGLFITQPDYEVTNDAHVLSVEVLSNVTFDVAPEAPWIHHVQTKGLSSSVITLSVDANETSDNRTGTVLVWQVDGDLAGKITITQKQTDRLFVSPTQFSLDKEEQTVELTVRNNVPFDVVIPEDARGWVSVQSNTQTRALTDDQVVLAIAENKTHDARSTVVTVKQKDGPLAGTVDITQAQSGFLTVTPTEFDLSGERQYIEILVDANQPWEMVLSEEGEEWIWMESNNPSGIPNQRILRVVIGANSTFAVREETILFRLKDGSADQSVTVRQSVSERRLREREVLIDLYNATDGPHWNDHTNWCSDKPFYEWSGVYTDVDGYVSGLNLTSYELKGKLPGEVWGLESLENLWLVGNDLEIRIPADPDSLSSAMVRLDLGSMCAGDYGETQVKGGLPASISKWRNLKYLTIICADLHGEIPDELWSLPELTDVSLPYNHLEGTLSPAIGNAKSLKYLTLTNNKLSGDIPEELCNLPNLAGIDLGNVSAFGSAPPGMVYDCNHFTKLPAHFGQLANLEWLQLNSLGIEDALPASVKDFTRLYSLDISNCQTTAGYRNHWDPDVLEKAFTIKSLNYLLVSQLELTGSIPESIGNLTNLVSLSIDRNNLSGPLPRNVSGMTNLVQIRGEENYLEGTIPDTYADIPELQYMFLANNCLSGPVSEKILSYPYFSNWDIDPQRPGYGLTFDIYESSDYSRDGTVIQLQAASEGRGIDLVVMGDAFADVDVENGTYGTVMNKAVEGFFAVEPYKSFRNLFNVYEVEVVSKNSSYAAGAEHALGTGFGFGTHIYGDDDKCFGYARLALSEARMQEALVLVVANRERYSGTCYMYHPSDGASAYASGAAVAYVGLCEDDESFVAVVQHEAGGHGFAKLDDEYVESHETIPDDVKQSRLSMFPKGWWSNIDFTNEPTEVKWARFLSDDRYADSGLGVFQGASTYTYGVWHPSQENIMVYNTGGFNAPSREAVYKRLNGLAYGSDWTYDYETFVSYDRVNRARTRAWDGVTKQYAPLARPVVKAGPVRAVRPVRPVSTPRKKQAAPTSHSIRKGRFVYTYEGDKVTVTMDSSH